MTAFGGPGTLDLSPAAVGNPTPLRFAELPTAEVNTHFVFDWSNIQGTEDREVSLRVLRGEFLFFDYDDFTQTVVGNERKLHNSKVFA